MLIFSDNVIASNARARNISELGCGSEKNMFLDLQHVFSKFVKILFSVIFISYVITYCVVLYVPSRLPRSYMDVNASLKKKVLFGRKCGAPSLSHALHTPHTFCKSTHESPLVEHHSQTWWNSIIRFFRLTCRTRNYQYQEVFVRTCVVFLSLGDALNYMCVSLRQDKSNRALCS